MNKRIRFLNGYLWVVILGLSSVGIWAYQGTDPSVRTDEVSFDYVEVHSFIGRGNARKPVKAIGLVLKDEKFPELFGLGARAYFYYSYDDENHRDDDDGYQKSKERKKEKGTLRNAKTWLKNRGVKQNEQESLKDFLSNNQREYLKITNFERFNFEDLESFRNFVHNVFGNQLTLKENEDIKLRERGIIRTLAGNGLIDINQVPELWSINLEEKLKERSEKLRELEEENQIVKRRLEKNTQQGEQSWWSDREIEIIMVILLIIFLIVLVISAKAINPKNDRPGKSTINDLIVDGLDSLRSDYLETSSKYIKEKEYLTLSQLLKNDKELNSLSNDLAQIEDAENLSKQIEKSEQKFFQSAIIKDAIPQSLKNILKKLKNDSFRTEEYFVKQFENFIQKVLPMKMAAIYLEESPDWILFQQGRGIRQSLEYYITIHSEGLRFETELKEVIRELKVNQILPELDTKNLNEARPLLIKNAPMIGEKLRCVDDLVRRFELSSYHQLEKILNELERTINDCFENWSDQGCLVEQSVAVSERPDKPENVSRQGDYELSRAYGQDEKSIERSMSTSRAKTMMAKTKQVNSLLDSLGERNQQLTRSIQSFFGVEILQIGDVQQEFNKLTGILCDGFEGNPIRELAAVRSLLEPLIDAQNTSGHHQKRPRRSLLDLAKQVKSITEARKDHADSYQKMLPLAANSKSKPIDLIQEFLGLKPKIDELEQALTFKNFESFLSSLKSLTQAISESSIGFWDQQTTSVSKLAVDSDAGLRDLLAKQFENLSFLLSKYHHQRKVMAQLEPFLESDDLKGIRRLREQLDGFEVLFGTKNLGWVLGALEHINKSLVQLPQGSSEGKGAPLFTDYKGTAQRIRVVIGSHRELEVLKTDYLGEQEGQGTLHELLRHSNQFRRQLQTIAALFELKQDDGRCLVRVLEDGVARCQRLQGSLNQPLDGIALPFSFEEFDRRMSAELRRATKAKREAVESKLKMTALQAQLDEKMNLLVGLQNELGFDPDQSEENMAWLSKSLQEIGGQLGTSTTQGATVKSLTLGLADSVSKCLKLLDFNDSESESRHLQVLIQGALNREAALLNIAEEWAQELGFNREDLTNTDQINRLQQVWAREGNNPLRPLRLSLAAALACSRLAGDELAHVQAQPVKKALHFESIIKSVVHLLQRLPQASPGRLWQDAVGIGFANEALNKLMRAYLILEAFYDQEPAYAYLLETMRLASNAIQTSVAREKIRFIKLPLLGECPNQELATEVGPADDDFCKVKAVRLKVQHQLKQGRTNFVVDVIKWPFYVGPRFSKGRVAVVHPGQWRGGHDL